MINPEELQQKISTYQEYLTVDPENCHLLITLGDTQHQAGFFSESKQSFLRCLDIQPDNQIARGRLANLLISQNRFDEAIREYLKLLEITPDNPQLKHNLALCHFYSYRFDEAQKLFSELVDHIVTNRSSRLHLASIEHIQGSLSKAIKACKQLLEEEYDDNIDGYLAVIEYTATRLDSALERAQKVLQLNPHNVDAAAVMAIHHTENLEVEEAEAYYDIMIRYAPYDARGWHGKGLVYMQNGEQEKAIEYLQKSVDLLPLNTGLLVTLGWALINNSQYSEAQNIFHQSVQIDPNFAESHGGLAVALLMQRKTGEARVSINRAERLDKHSFAGIYARSLLNYLQGHRDQATQNLAELLEQHPLPGRPKLIDAIDRSLKKKNIDISAIINRNTQL